MIPHLPELRSSDALQAPNGVGRAVVAAVRRVCVAGQAQVPCQGALPRKVVRVHLGPAHLVHQELSQVPDSQLWVFTDIAGRQNNACVLFQKLTSFPEVPAGAARLAAPFSAAESNIPGGPCLSPAAGAAPAPCMSSTAVNAIPSRL